MRVHNRQYEGRNPKQTKAAARARELKRYGLTPEMFQAIKRAQGGRCAVCRKRFPREGTEGKRIHVDHCHKTGRIRGILCSSCNTGIGKLGDSIEGLQLAIDYLHDFGVSCGAQALASLLPSPGSQLPLTFVQIAPVEAPQCPTSIATSPDQPPREPT